VSLSRTRPLFSQRLCRAPGGWYIVATGWIAAACSPAGPEAPAPAPLDPEQAVARASLADGLDTPHRVVFEWSMSEPGLRASGRGVARMEPPFRARLDLFLDNGEAAGRAALVGDDLRLPVDLPLEVVPPAHLLWGVLGVFRPEAGSYLAGAEQVDGETRIRYLATGQGGEVRYRLLGARMTQIEVAREGSVVQRVVLERDALGIPATATYRDLVAVRELKLTRVSVQQTEPFPPDIWYP
jgi:hypothetical protein